MSDRELLEDAAKAAGIPLKPDFKERFDYYMADRLMWNPLADDGDALRLAVKLDMCFGIAPHRVAPDKVSLALAPEGREVQQKHSGDPYAATRRAIVRAAAEIGRQMP